MLFQTRTGYDYNNLYSLCKGTCILGEISLIALVKELLKSQKLYDIKFKGYNSPTENTLNQLLIWILGSRVYMSSILTFRIDTEKGTIIYSSRNLFLPCYTEILVDSSGYYISYLTPDLSRSNNKLISVICARVLLQEHQGPLIKEPFGERVQGYCYNQERCIKIIRLKTLADPLTKY